MPVDSTVVERVRTKAQRAMLLQRAKAMSEFFARIMMRTGVDVDHPNADDAVLLESLNGINIYEETGSDRKSMSGKPSAFVTRLRSMCIIKSDLRSFVHHITGGGRADKFVRGLIDTDVLWSLDDDLRLSFYGHTSRGDAAEYAGINRFAVDAASPFVSHGGLASFHFTVLQYQGFFMHRKRRGWVQCFQSMDLPQDESANACKGRRHLYPSGIVAVESKSHPGMLEVTFACGIHRKCPCKAESHVLGRAVWHRVLRLASVKKALEQRSCAEKKA